MKPISIIIPAYNEATRIGNTLKHIHRYAAHKLGRYEVIVVDDGSTDKTADIATPYARLITQTNQGKGAAVRTGILAAQCEYILFTDADLSTPIHELEKLLAHIPGQDFVIGSRNCDGAKRVQDQPLVRRISGRIFNLCTRFILGRNIKDTQCGFKLFKRQAARTLFSRLHNTGFSFDVEILYRAQQLGMRYAEVGVEWHDDRRSTVRMKDSFIMLADILLLTVRS